MNCECLRLCVEQGYRVICFLFLLVLLLLLSLPNGVLYSREGHVMLH